MISRPRPRGSLQASRPAPASQRQSNSGGHPMVGVADLPTVSNRPEDPLHQSRSSGALRTVGQKFSRLGQAPVAAAATTGRGIALALSVLRYAVQDTLTRRLPVGEFVWQAWALFKVTATPAVLMAIPIGGIVTVVVSGLVAQVGATALLGAASGVGGVLRQGGHPLPQVC